MSPTCMKINVARQKQRRRYHGGDHAGAVRGHVAAGNHAAAGQQIHAAGLVVRRFAIEHPSENKSNVAIAEGRGNCVSIPG